MGQKLLFSVTKKDFEVTWYSGTGPGGQNRNKVQACCRIRHPESGATAQATDSRSRDANLKTAFKRLTASLTFSQWIRRKAAGELFEEAEITAAVEEAMSPENILVEGKNNGKWEEISL